MYGRQHENSCGRAVYCPLLLIHSLIHGFIHSNMMIDSLKHISQYYDLGNSLTFQASLFNLKNVTQSLFLNVLYGLNEIIYVILWQRAYAHK